jgi:hypothetical protein
MKTYTIAWDRKEKKFILTSGGWFLGLKEWFPDIKSALDRAFQLADRNRPAVVKWHRSDGTVKQYDVPSRNFPRFTKK